MTRTRFECFLDRCTLAVVGISAIGFALAACTPASDPTAMNATKVALTAAETAATIYVRLPLCPTAPVCSEPVVVAQIKAADEVAYAGVKAMSAGTMSPTDAAALVAKLVALVPVKK